jgi:hypothetical protein
MSNHNLTPWSDDHCTLCLLIGQLFHYIYMCAPQHCCLKRFGESTGGISKSQVNYGLLLLFQKKLWLFNHLQARGAIMICSDNVWPWELAPQASWRVCLTSARGLNWWSTDKMDLQVCHGCQSSQKVGCDSVLRKLTVSKCQHMITVWTFANCCQVPTKVRKTAQ